jgi:hypothetical protein
MCLVKLTKDRANRAGKKGFSHFANTENLEKKTNFFKSKPLTNSLLPKVSLSNSFSTFFNYKKLILPNLANFLYLQMYFGVGGGDIAQLSRHISLERGWDTSVGK